MITFPVPIKVIDIELSQPILDVENLASYNGVLGLVRFHGQPIGYIEAPITNGRCLAASIHQQILKHHSQTLCTQLIGNGLANGTDLGNLNIADLLNAKPTAANFPRIPVTVAVCTRDRADDLAICLEAIQQLDYANLDVLVVDNAPTTTATEELVRVHYPEFRYVCEPRPGLDWARNRAILEAKGEIIAYTDDDVVVDPGWVKALAQVFAENPQVMAVTGLVVPYELETEAQALFEIQGGFGRGFQQKWYQINRGNKVPWRLLGTGQFGTGANMAYRRSIFAQIGYFDPALDVGTPTNGGGDLEMYFRVLKAGMTLVYEPSALIRHRHRREMSKLKTQLKNNGSLFAYFMKCGMTNPDQWGEILKISIWWFRYWVLWRIALAEFHPMRFPKDIIWAELWGCFAGFTSYFKSKQRVAEIIQTFGDVELPMLTKDDALETAVPVSNSYAVAVRQVELQNPLQPLTELQDYGKVRCFVTWKDQPLGRFDIENRHQSVSLKRLQNEIAKAMDLKLLELDLLTLTGSERLARATTALTKYLSSKPNPEVEQLPASVSVSVVLATFDRPDDLRNCLQSLMAQETPRSVEIVVVDNHPSSGLTPPVVAEFPGVKLVNEPRQGLAYARNAGFVASTGDIAIATDDDVTQPPDWIETLVQPFARPDVMVVNGHVLPLQLETSSQRAFENYGGLGRGFEAFEVNGAWFDAYHLYPVPTWTLGATANAAFRASIFSHPQIGLMKEALGPGMPSGVGEDTYLFYKVLKAGYTVVYNPKAYVWHKHRQDDAALKRQIFGYSKGHVAYNLTTWLNDGDWRGVLRVVKELPAYHIWRLQTWLSRKSDYPLSLSWVEVKGNFLGAWCLWQSHQHVKREGRSNAYIPVSQRGIPLTETAEEVPDHGDRTVDPEPKLVITR